MRFDSVASRGSAATGVTGEIEVILLDVWLPGMDGLEPSAACKLRSSPAVIMISGHGTSRPRCRATKLALLIYTKSRSPSKKSLFWCATPFSNAGLQEENQLLRTELGHRYQVIWRQRADESIAPANCLTAPTNGRVLIYARVEQAKSWCARFARRESSHKDYS